MENTSRIRDEIEKFQSEIAGLEESKGGTSKEIEDKESQIADLRQTIEDSKDLFAEIQMEIESLSRNGRT